MNSSLTDFLRDQWSGASPYQYGSGLNPYVDIPATQGTRLPNGQRVGGQGTGPSGMRGLSQDIGTAPEVPINASTIGVTQPNCGPKMQAVIDPNTGRWTCQPTSGNGGTGLSFWNLIILAALAYLAYLWWKDKKKDSKSKSHTTHKGGDE